MKNLIAIITASVTGILIAIVVFLFKHKAESNYWDGYEAGFNLGSSQKTSLRYNQLLKDMIDSNTCKLKIKKGVSNEIHRNCKKN